MKWWEITLITVFVLLIALIIAVKIYLKISTGWCESKASLKGKTVIVTGANSGIGYETALDFAKRGGRVILACRDRDRAVAARDKIVQETNNEDVLVKLIDMSSLDSVRSFAKDIIETEERLDILVNNAGAGGIPSSLTKDGHLLIMQVNYLSVFLLTNLLIDLLKKSAPSRIVNVSSVAAKRAANLDTNNLDKSVGMLNDYYNTKLCVILFTKESARRLNGTGITSYSLHPGVIQTQLYRNIKIWMRLPYLISALFFKNAREGAQTTIHCSVHEGIEHQSGEHFAECRAQKPYKVANNDTLATDLWDKTVDLLKLNSEEHKI